MIIRHGKYLLRNRRGYSALIATIIMVLVVLFLYFNVFMLSVNRNTDYQDVVTRSNQLDADKRTEQMSISVSATARAIVGSTYKVSCYVTDTGSLPVKVVRVWVRGLQQGEISYPVSAPNVLQAGDRIDVLANINVLVSGSYLNNPNTKITITVVTSRGNVMSTLVTQN
jgi:hypothetical protein